MGLLSQRKQGEARLLDTMLRLKAVDTLYMMLRDHLVATGKMTRGQLDGWEREHGAKELSKLGIKVQRVQTAPSAAGLVDPSGAPMAIPVGKS